MPMEKKKPARKRGGVQRQIISLKPTSGKHDLYFVFSHPGLENPQDYAYMVEWLLFTEKLPAEGRPEFAQVKENLLALLNSKAERTPIMLENPADFRRQTRVFDRGNWLTKGKEVQPGTPKILPAFASYPQNRLGLAQRMVSQATTQTARLTETRVSDQIFRNAQQERLDV